MIARGGQQNEAAECNILSSYIWPYRTELLKKEKSNQIITNKQGDTQDQDNYWSTAVHTETRHRESITLALNSTKKGELALFIIKPQYKPQQFSSQHLLCA